MLVEEGLEVKQGQVLARLDDATAKRQVALVEAQEDPAMLINLGVELARAGETEAARLAFEKVRRMRIDYTLETTDGRYVHPADLAAQGLRMLENGEFRSSDDTVLGG